MASQEMIHISEKTLADEIFDKTGVLITKCYQCGKCSAGCPLINEMDIPPSLLMRMLQVGTSNDEERILSSYTIWLCLSCIMCYERCPMEIDIPLVMNFLREKSLKTKKVNKKAKDIVAFYKAFLKSVNKTGKLYELYTILDYKLKTFHFFQDMTLAPKMLLKNKLLLVSEKIKDKKSLKRIFNKA